MRIDKARREKQAAASRKLLIAAFGLILLCLSPHHLLAQRGGGRGRGGGGSSGASGGRGGAADTPEMGDFKRAVALQASEGQAAQFHSLTQDTESARKQVEDLLQHCQDSQSPSDLQPKAASMNKLLSQIHTEDEDFLKTFSDLQKSGLKKQAKSLSKADSDASQHWKALSRDLEQGKSGRIMKEGQELRDALTKLQDEQKQLGEEMGVQSRQNDSTK